MEKPLSKIKVVDFTTFVAAPSTAMLLGYMGAEVIKVEPPKGDAMRWDGAWGKVPTGPECSLMYEAVNSYKKGISLNLRTKEGMDVLLRLIGEADIFVSNYRTPALTAMGIDYESVKRLNPRIVFAHLDGYGSKGPDTKLQAFDSLTFFNRSGLALASQYTGEPPLITPYGAGDLVSGLALLSAILGALYQARETGEGCKVTTSLMAGGLWVMNSGIVQSQFMGNIAPEKELCDALTVRHFYTCADGTILRIFIGFAERYWDDFCRAFEIEEYIGDPRFNTGKAMTENGRECIKIMQDAIGKKPFSYWDQRIKDYDLPIGKVVDAVQAVNDPQAVANDFVTTLDYPQLGRTVGFAMPPMKLESVPEEGRTYSPKLGEHTEEILRSAGYSEEEITALLDSGAANQFGRGVNSDAGHGVTSTG